MAPGHIVRAGAASKRVRLVPCDGDEREHEHEQKRAATSRTSQTLPDSPGEAPGEGFHQTTRPTDQHDYHDNQTITSITSHTRDGSGSSGSSDSSGGIPGFEQSLVAAARDVAHGLLAPDAVYVREHRKAFLLSQRLLTVPGAREAIAEDYGVLDAPVRAFATLHALDAETFLLAVANAIPKVTGTGHALAKAVAQARRSPVALCHPVDRLGKTFQLVIGTAYWLQDFAKEKPIRLPRRQLGLLLGVTSRRISDAVSLALQHGLLAEVSATYSYTEHKAKEYRFNYDSVAYLPPGREGAS